MSELVGTIEVDRGKDNRRDEMMLDKTKRTADGIQVEGHQEKKQGKGTTNKKNKIHEVITKHALEDPPSLVALLSLLATTPRRRRGAS